MARYRQVWSGAARQPVQAGRVLAKQVRGEEQLQAIEYRHCGEDHAPRRAPHCARIRESRPPERRVPDYEHPHGTRCSRIELRRYVGERAPGGYEGQHKCNKLQPDIGTLQGSHPETAGELNRLPVECAPAPASVNYHRLPLPGGANIDTQRCAASRRRLRRTADPPRARAGRKRRRDCGDQGEIPSPRIPENACHRHWPAGGNHQRAGEVGAGGHHHRNGRRRRLGLWNRDLDRRKPKVALYLVPRGMAEPVTGILGSVLGAHPLYVLPEPARGTLPANPLGHYRRRHRRVLLEQGSHPELVGSEGSPGWTAHVARWLSRLSGSVNGGPRDSELGGYVGFRDPVSGESANQCPIFQSDHTPIMRVFNFGATKVPGFRAASTMGKSHGRA